MLKSSKILFIILRCLIDVIVTCMKEHESNLDADGIPLDIDEYNKLSYMRSVLYDLCNHYENYEEE